MRSFREFLLEASALAFASAAHAGQKRASGMPYIVHPTAVAATIEKYRFNSKNLSSLRDAALLHDTVEDTKATVKEIRELFGDLVAGLVQELTDDVAKIADIGNAKYLAHKMANMSGHALLIKLADRLDNVSDIATVRTPNWRRNYKTETEYILNHVEQSRAMTRTHKNIIADIRKKLREVK